MWDVNFSLSSKNFFSKKPKYYSVTLQSSINISIVWLSSGDLQTSAYHNSLDLYFFHLVSKVNTFTVLSEILMFVFHQKAKNNTVTPQSSINQSSFVSSQLWLTSLLETNKHHLMRLRCPFESLGLLKVN